MKFRDNCKGGGGGGREEEKGRDNLKQASARYGDLRAHLHYLPPEIQMIIFTYYNTHRSSEASLIKEYIKALQEEVFTAIRTGDTKRLQTAIDRGVDVNTQNLKGKTPVFIATQQGNDACLSQLIAAGADVYIADTPSRPCPCGDVRCADRAGGRTPVYIAAKEVQDACLTLLITAGADVNTQDTKWSQTPVFLATYFGHDICLSQLIAAGADVNTQDRGGWTPLQIATQRGKESCVKLLRAAGAVEE